MTLNKRGNQGNFPGDFSFSNPEPNWTVINLKSNQEANQAMRSNHAMPDCQMVFSNEN
jgi:hypothetical protein